MDALSETLKDEHLWVSKIRRAVAYTCRSSRRPTMKWTICRVCSKRSRPHWPSPKYGWEVIITDDASTDGTAAVLQDLRKKHPQLRVLSMRQRSGQTAAVDAGLRHAQGHVHRHARRRPAKRPGGHPPAARHLAVHSPKRAASSTAGGPTAGIRGFGWSRRASPTACGTG